MMTFSLLLLLSLLVVVVQALLPPLWLQNNTILLDSHSDDQPPKNHSEKNESLLLSTESNNVFRYYYKDPRHYYYYYHHNNDDNKKQQQQSIRHLSSASTNSIEDELHIHAARYCLFPSFTLTIGTFCFYILSRYASKLPYTAIMFLIGTIMGIGATSFDHTNQLNETIQLWIPINAEVLLLVFLPGLIFKDSMGQNVHLFSIAFGQCLLFAFPLVLGGTFLTACVAKYVFPYGWSFNLAMTFGAILSATDPVAVAALLEQVGAPPRLKTHIAGEALLNDGSSIVFFSIFIQRYLYEFQIPDVGSNVDFAEGVTLFCRKALGGVAIGIFFGFGLLGLIHLFNRRFNNEETVVEVTTTAAIAYLGYYVADAVWATSGVICNVTMGIIIQFLGRHKFLNVQLLDNFWILVEHILNTILFTLGGMVWGGVLVEGERNNTFVAKDWGYLVVLYILLLVIRAVLFALFYPITVRIGLKTNWKETVFQIYGGLRGAVGIALAIFLEDTVTGTTNVPYQDDTTKAFAMVGGIAFLTLVINGTTAGPLLHYLQLADTTTTRQTIVAAYQTRFRNAAVDTMVKLLSQQRFRTVNFLLVKQYIPYLADLTKEQLIEAVKKHRETTLRNVYEPPFLGRVLPYLPSSSTSNISQSIYYDKESQSDDDDDDIDEKEQLYYVLDAAEFEQKVMQERRARLRKKKRARAGSIMHLIKMDNAFSTPVEHRQLFLSVVRSAYERQIANGELQSSSDLLAISLLESLESASDLVSRGEPISDWECLMTIDGPLIQISHFLHSKFWSIILWNKGRRKSSKAALDMIRIERCLSYVAAHEYAQDHLMKEFHHCNKELSECMKIVISESQANVAKAQESIQSFSEPVLATVSSIKFCSIILYAGVQYLTKLRDHGLLKDSETEHLVHALEQYLEIVESSEAAAHTEILRGDDNDKNTVTIIFEEKQQEQTNS